MVTDNTIGKKNLTEANIKNIDEMKGQIPQIEKILTNVGKILPDHVPMWYTGFAWYVKLDSKRVYLKIQYSDKRFEIHAIKLEKSEIFNESLYMNRDSDNRFELCKFTDWITIDRIGEKLVSFYNIL